MRPVFDIWLLGSNGRTQVEVVLDSGADYSIFPVEKAEVAGIPLPLSPNFRIQYGGACSFGRKATVFIELSSNTRLETDVFFVKQLPFPHALLGRYGVFNQFNEIAFLEKQKTPRMELRR